MEKYYLQLGLTSGASMQDVKKAYRRLALQYHPDRNKSAEAEAQFRLIAEAYQRIITYEDGSYWYQEMTVHEDTSDSETQAREAARQKQEEAFRAYMQTDDFKFWFYLEVLGQMVMTIILSAFIVGMVAVMTYLGGVNGFIVGILPVVACSYIIYQAVAPTFHPFTDYSNAIQFFFNKTYLFVFALIVFNTVVFFKIGMNTFFPSILLIAGFVMSFLFFIYWIRTHSLFDIRNCFAASIPTLTLNVLLLMNYMFASPAKVYFYRWEPHIEVGRSTTRFDLENNVFEREWHARTLIDFAPMDNAEKVGAEALNTFAEANRLTYFRVKDNVVEMHLAKGWLGFPVLKHYTFIFVNRD
jgi:hypothetical protein